MKQTKKYQKGDAGATMLVVMVVMMLGFFGYQGMHSDAGHSSSVPSSASQQEKTPLDLLDEMYARGDISREDYFRKREDLLKRL